MSKIFSIKTKNEIATIVCVACDKESIPHQNYTDSCVECVEHPKRGVRYIELTKRVRTDPAFALKCFNGLGSAELKEFFLQKFGTSWLKPC